MALYFGSVWLLYLLSTRVKLCHIVSIQVIFYKGKGADQVVGPPTCDVSAQLNGEFIGLVRHRRKRRHCFVEGPGDRVTKRQVGSVRRCARTVHSRSTHGFYVLLNDRFGVELNGPCQLRGYCGVLIIFVPVGVRRKSFGAELRKAFPAGRRTLALNVGEPLRDWLQNLGQVAQTYFSLFQF